MSDKSSYVKDAMKYIDIKVKNSRSKTSRQAINEKEDCYSGGNMTYKGSVDNSGGSVSVIYNECKMSGATMNGTVKVEAKGEGMEEDDEKLTYMKISFPSDFETKSGAHSSKIFKGSSIVAKNFTNDGQTFDMGTTIKTDIDGKIAGSVDSKYHFSHASVYQTSGKEYVNNGQNYVEYDKTYDMSKTPFVLNYDGTIKSGEAHYITANNGKIIVKATSSDEFTVFIDADGDGNYEKEEIISQR